MGNRKTESNQKWKRKNIDRVMIAFPKGKKEIIREYANAQGKTLTAYIIDVLERDSGIAIRERTHM